MRQLARVLFQQIDDQGLGVTRWAPVGLFMPGCDPVQPDLLVILAADLDVIGEQRLEGVPALLIEVLPPSTAAHDLATKRAAYARPGAPEYWVARSRERDVLAHSQPESATGQYLRVTHAASDGDLVSPTLAVRVPVAALFAGLPPSAG